MKKLYYIEQETFLREMVEGLCKQNGEMECYTTDEGRERLYFFNDLKPDFILIDWETIAEYQEELLSELQEVSQIPFGVTTEPGIEIPSPWIEGATLKLEKPIVAKSLLKKVFP
jgi:chemotaxis response regulator CheB